MASVTYPEDSLGPDELLDPRPRLWPATDIVPFHYEHPVTGKPIEIDNRRAREASRTGDGARSGRMRARQRRIRPLVDRFSVQHRQVHAHGVETRRAES